MFSLTEATVANDYCSNPGRSYSSAIGKISVLIYLTTRTRRSFYGASRAFLFRTTKQVTPAGAICQCSHPVCDGFVGHACAQVRSFQADGWFRFRYAHLGHDNESNASRNQSEYMNATNQNLVGSSFFEAIHEPRTHIQQIAVELQEEFRRCYPTRARIYRAPGRVNLIGGHTDYNDGFVMPAAIEFYVWVAIAPRNDRKLVVHSAHFSDHVDLDLNGNPGRRNHWSDYIAGVAEMLGRVQILRGANVLVRSDVPLGSGLGFSAAIEVATGFALMENSGFRIARVDLARLCQRAENEFIGARASIMNQFISCFGQLAHALMLDCRSLRYRLLSLPRDISLVICNTMVKHEFAKSEYNARRAQCEEGLRLLVRELRGVRALRDLSLAEVGTHASELSDVVYRRCRHVVTENARVTEGADAIEGGDLDTFGRLMYASHVSLRDDYEVSCPELDLMVELARQQEGVFGACMTGGGFGGCTINLVRSDAVPKFQAHVAAAYEQVTKLAPQIFVSGAAERAGEVLG
jgi:galactokinase